MRVTGSVGSSVRFAPRGAGASVGSSPGPTCVLGAGLGLAHGVGRAGDGTAHLARVHPEPAGEVAHVAHVEGPIPDAGDDGSRRPQGRHPPLDGLEVVAGEATTDHELEHRLAGGDQLTHRLVATMDAQIARVEVVGGDRHEGLRGEALLLRERPARGSLAGLIRVEGEDDLAGGRRIRVLDVAEHPAHHLDVVDTERGAAGGDRGRDPGEMAGHHVGVALDDHHLLALGDVATCQVEPVEHLALVEDEGLGRVEVLGALIVVEQLARAEADGLAGDVADRPDHPTAETVVAVAPIARREQPGGGEFVGREPLLHERVLERVERLRRVPDAEAIGGGLVESAGTEEIATRLRARFGELRAEELLGRSVGGQQAGTVAVVGGRARSVFVVQLDAGPGRHAFDGLLERDVVHALQEGEDVAVLAASEAVVPAHLRSHVEAGTALLVERAEPLERADARRLQRHVVADDVGDVDA